MPVWKHVTVWVLRLLIGGVFVMSGLVKSLDLWGFVYKIEEYLAIWDMSQPRTIVFMLAMGVAGYEFVLGLLLAMGCYKRVAPWGLFLTMVVMLPLTAYIWIADPVSDCGCFGDVFCSPWCDRMGAGSWKKRSSVGRQDSDGCMVCGACLVLAGCKDFADDGR